MGNTDSRLLSVPGCCCCCSPPLPFIVIFSTGNLSYLLIHVSVLTLRLGHLGNSYGHFFQKRKTGKNYLPGVMQVLKGNENLQTCSQPKCSSFWPSLLSEAKPLQANTLALCRQLGLKLEI